MMSAIERLLTEKKSVAKTVPVVQVKKAASEAQAFLGTLDHKVKALQSQMNKAIAHVDQDGKKSCPATDAQRLCMVMKLAADVMDWGEREACDVRISMEDCIGRDCGPSAKR